MSAHAAGAGALMAGTSDWTPHQIKSAIMMSAVNATVVKKTDQHRPMRLIQALVVYASTGSKFAGLTTEQTTANVTANPILGGDPPH